MLDDVGWMLLEELQRNGRASYRELGVRVGLTAPAVADRVRKMERDGIITGYRAEVDHEKLGVPIRAIIRVKTSAASVGQVDEIVQNMPEVVECHHVTGSENHVIRARLRSTKHLEELLYVLSPYGETVTNIVMSSAVDGGVLTREIANG